MQWIPGINQILVQKPEHNAMSAGGIALPDNYRQEDNTGIVKSIGPMEEGVPKMALSVGTSVKYRTGTPIRLDGEEYDLVNVLQIACYKN